MTGVQTCALPISPSLPQDFKGYNANVEMELSAPNFMSTIDIVFLPGFYDLYDMLNLPVPTYNFAP